MKRIIAGLDIGNGYVKGKANVDGKNPVLVDLPSTVSYIAGSDVAQVATDEYMKDFINKMDATIISRGIKPMDNGRVLFGVRAIHTGGSQVEFNIDNHKPKSEDSLSTMLVLGSLASIALEDYWNENHSLPTEVLSIKAVIGVALPIEDYTNYKPQYVRTFMGSTHHVHIHNFENDITVEIAFDDVQVLPEGAAGQYAISDLKPEVLQALLDIARSQGFNIDEAYTGQMLADARNTIGVDIGEGTVNFPVFEEGLNNIESSSSINKGYGTVLSNVVAKLRNTSMSFESRKDLADFLLADDLLPMQKAIKSSVEHYVESEVLIFVRDVIKEYSNIFRKVGIRTQVIYVYGGGANAVQHILHQALADASTFENGANSYSTPIIYLDSKYSRDLNRNGLYQAAVLSDMVLKKK